MTTPHAVIVLGHGSRSDDFAREFETLVELVRTRTGESRVYGAHMSLAEPSLEQAISRAVETGARHVTIVPCFLFHGNHIKEDIPQMLTAQRDRYPGVRIEMARHIGPDERLAAIVCDRIAEVP